MRAVCFSPKKKSEFDLAHFDTKPVALKNFKIKNNYGNDNIMMSNKTLNSDSILKEEEFKRIDIPDTLGINSLNKVAPEQLVSFKPKLSISVVLNCSRHKKDTS